MQKTLPGSEDVWESVRGVVGTAGETTLRQLAGRLDSFNAETPVPITFAFDASTNKICFAGQQASDTPALSKLIDAVNVGAFGWRLTPWKQGDMLVGCCLEGVVSGSPGQRPILPLASEPRVKPETAYEPQRAEAVSDRRDPLVAEIGRDVLAYFEAHTKAGPSIRDGIWYFKDYADALRAQGQPLPDRLEHGLANPSFFENLGTYDFRLRQGLSASEALAAFLRGPTVADCGCIFVACYYRAVQKYLGSEKFDAVFGSTGGKQAEPFRLRIAATGVADQNPLSHFFYFNAAAYDDDAAAARSPGEMVHIAGVPHYAHKHPVGLCGGFNVLATGATTPDGAPLFVGFGLPRPMTENQIKKFLVDGYNAPRTLYDLRAIADSDKKHLYDLAARGYRETCDVADTRGLLAGSSVSLRAKRLRDAAAQSAAQTTAAIFHELIEQTEFASLRLVRVMPNSVV